jgi:hypothetical protein
LPRIARDQIARIEPRLEVVLLQNGRQFLGRLDSFMVVPVVAQFKTMLGASRAVSRWAGMLRIRDS